MTDTLTDFNPSPFYNRPLAERYPPEQMEKVDRVIATLVDFAGDDDLMPSRRKIQRYIRTHFGVEISGFTINALIEREKSRRQSSTVSYGGSEPSVEGR